MTASDRLGSKVISWMLSFTSPARSEPSPWSTVVVTTQLAITTFVSLGQGSAWLAPEARNSPALEPRIRIQRVIRPN
ncbi:hypothetical protein MK489_04980 [Myxococcota bacterium]|nr:hypothetical protein [Myxococcota bacterium]